jgi:hypothetical protein
MEMTDVMLEVKYKDILSALHRYEDMETMCQLVCPWNTKKLPDVIIRFKDDEIRCVNLQISWDICAQLLHVNSANLIS